MSISFQKFIKLLKKKHMTKKDVSLMASVHPSTLSRLQNGSGNVELKTLYLLCQALECKLEDIVEFDFEAED